MKLNENYQVLPSMSDEQFQALKADIAERGVLTPIDVDDKGFILDGHHRYRACVELGITDFPTIIRLDLTEDEKRMFARKSNMLRRHLTQEQMREIIASQLRDTPKWANNRIAQELGVDSKTVATVREKLEATLEIPKLDRLIGADGKERPVKQPRKPSIMAANEAEYNEALDKVAREVSRLTGQGFLSVRQGMIALTTPGYDPFFGLTEDEVKEWEVFALFLMEICNHSRDGASAHVEWLRNKDFKTPTEWLGPDGQSWARDWHIPASEKVKASWRRYWQSKQGLSREAIGQEIKQLFDSAQAQQPVLAGKG